MSAVRQLVELVERIAVGVERIGREHDRAQWGPDRLLRAEELDAYLGVGKGLGMPWARALGLVLEVPGAGHRNERVRLGDVVEALREGRRVVPFHNPALDELDEHAPRQTRGRHTRRQAARPG